jgi:hypothetical protein
MLFALRIVGEITDIFSIPSPCPLPSGARERRTVISRTILSVESVDGDVSAAA